ncbi:Methionine gamma-lyase [Ruegeria sp. THAF57]|uniref:trans-sulfuration enzyme family protein n=1 Tax=Ruegeria sp. THAF57 TaxID=2744555 RepID=UPI0015DE3823|nr:PLP-dependent aspartate aminotransferase family protein [Ruegeria sp. THAF57]CAD0186840.1 Methionine gamma-lyase [Ruegeria sp. THAF57]
MRRDTKLIHYGRGPLPGPANPSIERASTILHDTMSTFRDAKERRETDDHVVSYGRRGTSTAHALSAALCDLEQGDACYLYPSGVAAITTTLSAFLRPGDHMLMVDEAFHASQSFCRDYLAQMDVSFSSIPWDATDLSPYLKPNTKLVLVESPTSLTFKVMDLRALCDSAKDLNLTVVADNTYGSGWLYQPLCLGCDVSIISGTKYLSGHADTMIGAAVSKGDASAPLRAHTLRTGQLLAPDEAYACLRGLRTLSLRLDRHAATSQQIATWLVERPEVKRVWHPGLADHPGHNIWARDASGVNGLLSLSLADGFDPEVFVDTLKLFAIGASWGGFESLALALQPKSGLTSQDHPQVRLHAGLEHADDLIEDIRAALSKSTLE